ncbi:MAG: antibiotic biosynthesis monooxygenase [Deltaproteobacteria bacterium]|nr:antibiotic biosynthesis monooxygenase [Deltaproteobacteria bacterium]
MYCKTFRTKLTEEGMAVFEEFVQKKYQPLISKQPGFKGAFFCRKANHEFEMIMFWEEERNITQWSENQEHKKIGAEIKSIYQNEIFQDFYEVEATISLRF